MLHQSITAEDIERAADVLRSIASTVTVNVQPAQGMWAGEQWTVSITEAGAVGIGQGPSLGAAIRDIGEERVRLERAA